MDKKLGEAILGYSPKEDNPTGDIPAKIKDISDKMKLPPDTPMKSLTPDQLQQFKDLMVHYEGTKVGKEYTREGGKEHVRAYDRSKATKR